MADPFLWDKAGSPVEILITLEHSSFGAAAFISRNPSKNLSGPLKKKDLLISFFPYSRCIWNNVLESLWIICRHTKPPQAVQAFCVVDKSYIYSAGANVYWWKVKYCQSFEDYSLVLLPLLIDVFKFIKCTNTGGG